MHPAFYVVDQTDFVLISKINERCLYMIAIYLVFQRIS